MERLSFQGEWRDYQKKVLDQASTHLKDGKIHIVAAPGSGKTTLGIELICRLNQPTLILAPNITIREQWIERIKHGFLTDVTIADELVSNTLNHPKQITVITYQALHSCVTHYQGKLVEEEGEESETVDFKKIDIYQIMKEYQIKTVCLDECHHLKTEWWKALTEVLQKNKEVTMISLTATPPYDSSEMEWQRYIELCGEIDEEIFTPELVQEGTLCPHQDYVYFNWPTREERRSVDQFRDKVRSCLNELMNSEQLYSIISSYQGFQNPEGYADKLLEDPKYLYALLIYCKQKNLTCPDYFYRLLDVKKTFLPSMTPKYMEVLLQNMLYIDGENYNCDEGQKKEILDCLKKYGCIQKNKITFLTNERLSKLLISSKGKLNSMVEIVKEEYRSLQEELRLLILCDFIKKETVSLINTDTKITEMGAIPIFETIRRANISGIRLAVLSGGIIVVPKVVLQDVEKELVVLEKTLKIKEMVDIPYVIVETNANTGEIVKIITEQFQKGKINVLIGTKSLLGEGWDSPCINSLILASFIGSFVLSNQMRGRAIRVMKDQPNKVSNIWHLVCLEPQEKKEEIQLFKKESEDLRLMKRRFETFLGLHYEKAIIENGFDRITFAHRSYDEKAVEEINQLMLKKAEDRSKLKEEWNEALFDVRNGFEIENITSVPVKEIREPEKYVFVNFLVAMILSMIWTGLTFLLNFLIRLQEYGGFIVLIVGLIGVMYFIITNGYKVFAFFTPQRQLKKFGQGILVSLQDLGYVSPYVNHVVIEKSNSDVVVGVYLSGGTAKEKVLFSKCVKEFFSAIENQRYLLIKKSITKNLLGEYFVVPEVFSTNKKNAELFTNNLKRLVKGYQLVYTRNPEGRKQLLRGRSRGFASQNEAVLNNLLGVKKKVKGKYE